MPYEWDEKKRAYRDTNTGQYVSRRDIKARIDKLTRYVTKQAGRIGKRYDSGALSAGELNTEMRTLLKSGHIVAASVGRGGRDRMTQADWGRVGRKIRWQYQYLDKFTDKLGRGTLQLANTAYRARQYVNAIYISYATAEREAYAEFIEEGGDVNPKNEMLCYLQQNSEEGCEECAADAALGPIPVSEMGELGSRICGDFCKCEIIFEDEPEFSN